MRKKIVFISDFFSDHGVGGAELNDTEIIEYFSSYTTVSKIQSHLVKEQFLDENKDCFYIISNFCNLSYKTKRRTNCKRKAKSKRRRKTNSRGKEKRK